VAQTLVLLRYGKVVRRQRASSISLRSDAFTRNNVK